MIYISHFLDALGFNTQYSSKSYHKLANYIPILCHAILVVIHVGFYVKVNNWISNTADNLEIVNNFLQYSAAASTHLLIIFELYAQRMNRYRFWQLFRKIEEYRRTVRLFTIIFIEYVLLSLVIILYFIVEVHSFEFSRIVVSFMYMILAKICEFAILNYSFFLNAILYQLQSIEYKLRKFTHEDLNHQERNVFEQFRCIEERLGVLGEMVDALNRIFGWSHFIAILNIFLSFTTNMSWLLLYAYTTSERTSIGEYQSIFCLEFFGNVLKFYFEVGSIWSLQIFFLILYVFYEVNECFVVVSKFFNQELFIGQFLIENHFRLIE